MLGVVFGVVLLGLIGYGLLVYSSLSRFAHYWQTQNQQAVAADSLTLVAFGDSTVQGIGATSPGRGFVGQLAGQLQTAERPAQIYNYSKSGAVASDVSGQITQASMLSDADIVVVAVGPNDLTRGVAMSDYLASYEQILQQLPKGKVVIASIPPLVRSTVSDQTVQDWNQALAGLAAKYDVPVAPVYEAIKPQQYNPLIYSVDLFHPSNIGYGLWAKAFYQVSQRLSFQR